MSRQFERISANPYQVWQSEYSLLYKDAQGYDKTSLF